MRPVPAGRAGPGGSLATGRPPRTWETFSWDTEPRKVLEQVSEMTKLIFK